MNKVMYSAAAKCFISGEHSVVYGKPAIITALDKRLTFTAKKSRRDELNGRIKQIYEIVKNDSKVKNNITYTGGISFAIQSSIPKKRGLGSSAALCVASCASFYHLITNISPSEDLVNQLAYQAEKIFHRNPSGVDNSVSTFGGLLYYRKEFEFLKGIYQLQYKIPQTIQEKLFLIDSGKPTESTGDLVYQVGKLYNKNPQDTEKIFQEIEKITKKLVMSIITENHKLFKDQIEKNQSYLEKLDIVSIRTKKLIWDLSNIGSAKVTGAGGKKTGSGYLLVYTDKPVKLREFVQRNKLTLSNFVPSLKGLQYHG